MNVKFHKNCDYTGKILKISCERCNFGFFWCYYRWFITSLALEKCKKECNNYALNYSGTRFLSTENQNYSMFWWIPSEISWQVVDMRWGVRDDATDAHMTTELCLREIKACQEISVGPNFVVSYSRSMLRLYGNYYMSDIVIFQLTRGNWILCKLEPKTGLVQQQQRRLRVTSKEQEV